MKKLLSIGIILLFSGIAVSNSIAVETNNKQSMMLKLCNKNLCYLSTSF